MKSSQFKRSIVLDGRKTSISLEDSFWTGLKEIADFHGVTPSELISAINATRKESNLASATRIFVLEHFQNKNKSADLPRSKTPRSAVIKADHLWLGVGLQGATDRIRSVVRRELLPMTVGKVAVGVKNFRPHLLPMSVFCLGSEPEDAYDGRDQNPNVTFNRHEQLH